MRNVFIFFAFLIAGMAHAQIITNVDKLRIRDVERGLDSDKILVIDSGNVVRWTDAIEIDLSDYYTISEVDAFVADLEAGLLERYTKHEVDALLDGLELRLDDYYTKAEVDSIITNINDRVDSLELEVEQIDLNTVTSVDNVTSIKIRGSDIFTNNLETDFAQIADVNKAGFGLISMQSEMKIGLVAKDGTTLLDDVDVSWLASGDLAVTIDDTDPNNPELVFSQNGVEVARISASTLLSGVARSANLSNYILQFKDGTGAVVYSVNLEPLFEDYFTKAEANDRFALRTRTITGTGGLTGGGNLTANRTIALSTTTQEDIAKGVEAHGWGDHNGNYIPFRGNYTGDLDEISTGSFGLGVSTNATNAPFNSPGGLWSMSGALDRGAGTQILGDRYGNNLSFRGFAGNSYSDWREVWHDGNFTPSNYYTKTESNNIFEPIFSKNTAFNKNFGTGSNDVARGNHTHTFASLTNKPTTLSGFGITDGVPNSRTISAGNGLTGGGNLTANRTIALSTTTQEDIAKGVEAHGWGDFREWGLGTRAIQEIESNESKFIRQTNSTNKFGGIGVGINVPLGLSSTTGQFRTAQLFINRINTESFTAHIGSSYDGVERVRELWHSGNLTKLSQLENDLPSQLQTINLDSSHPYRATLSGNNSSVDLTHLRVNPITNPDAKPTFNLNYLQGWRDVFQSPSVGIRAIRSSTNSISFGIDFGFNRPDRKFKVRYLDNAGWHPTENVATESWVNDQGFLKTAQAPLTNSTTNTISGNQVRREALVGDVTAPFNSNTTTIANNAVTLPKLGADVRSAIDSKEPKLSAGTLAQLMTGTNTQNRKWSAKVINDFVERKQTEASVITAKGYSAALPETSPKPLYLNITTINQLGLVNDGNTTVKLPISDATYEISILATGGYTPLQNAYIAIYFGGKIRGIYINADMSSFSYQTEVFTVTKESEREIRVAQTTVLENLEITVTIKKISG